MVPEDMKGKILMPLNELKKVHPEIYKEHLKKYIGREILLKEKVPILNCLWNDVLFFTSVHPLKLKNALREAGSKWKGKNQWFKIDPRNIDPENTVVDLYKTPGLNLNPEDYVPFRISDLRKYSEIGPKTQEYFRNMLSKGRKPLPFHFVPHILHKGTLDTSKLDIVDA